MRPFVLSLVIALLASCGGESPSPGSDTTPPSDTASADVNAEEPDTVASDVVELDSGDMTAPAGEVMDDGAVADAIGPDDASVDVLGDGATDDALGVTDAEGDTAGMDASGDVAPDVPPEPIEVPGDQCDEALVIDPLDLPFEYQGDTTHAADHVSLAGGCGTGGDIGTGAPDVFFSFTPEVTAHHVVGMNPATVIGASPAVIYVVKDCANAAFSCVGVSSNLSAGGIFSVYLEAETTYAIVIDGLLPEDRGGFTFVVEEVVCVIECPGPECGKDGCGGFCGEGCAEGLACRPDGVCETPPLIDGNTCEAPFLIESLPYATTGDTWYGTHEGSFDANSCPGEPHPIGAASNDHFYHLEIPSTGLYSLAITTDYDAALYVIEDCADLSGSCIAGSDQSLSSESMEIYLEAGQSVTIVVDGYGNTENMNGVYTLQVSQACVASCEGQNCGDDGCGGSCGVCVYGDACLEGVCHPAPVGDTCLDPFVIPSAPHTVAGDTSGFHGEMSYAPGECPGMTLGWGAGSKDVVYAFEPTAQDLYTLTLDATFDSTLYVVTDCQDVSGSCLAADDQHPTMETINVWMYPGTTYFIVVDGYGNQSNVEGPYSLSIASACVPHCKFKECGPDGCGGSCGECEGFSVCSDEGLCESQEGNSCDTPFLIGALPFSAEGDSSDSTNLMGVPYDACPDETAVRGPVSAEEVWSYTPTESGVYTALLDSTFPAVLYTLTDCAQFTTECFYEENPGALVWYNVHPECGWAHYEEGQCVGLGVGFLLSGEVIALKTYLEAETTYFYVVDGNALNSNQSGPYTLSLDGPCIPQCDGKACGADGCGLTCGECSNDMLCDENQQCVTQEGNSCDEAFVIPEDVTLPVVYEGSTADATNTYGKPYGGCPDENKKIGAGSRDEVYAFTPVEDGTYEMTIEAQFQGALYVLNDCSEFLSECFYKETLGHDSWTGVVQGCGFMSETCLAAFIVDPEEPEGLLSVELVAGETVYIVVDGLGGLYDTFGSYALTIERACDPQCEGKQCGDDGCGDVCGVCPGGFICDDTNVCIDVTQTPGNSCETALLVESIPFLAAGDTSDNSDVYIGDNCTSVSVAAVAEGARDEVWIFTPEQSGLYLVDISGQDGFEPIVYVVSDCSDEGWNCLKGTNDVTMDIALDAGQAYFIIVDGGTDPDDPPPTTDGGYVLEVTLP
jgi:hypothetical protein